MRHTSASGSVLAAAAAALCGLAAAVGGAGPAAQAAPVPARASGSALHVAGTVNLGKVSSSAGYVFAEAPNGVVYYGSGPLVYVVDGTSSPVVLLQAAGTVLGVAANSADLFVQTGRTVTEYSRAAGTKIGTWTLPFKMTPTSASLFAVGGTVWSSTDWATDESGLEYATVYRMATSSSTVHTVANSSAYPFDMAADSGGLYFEAVRRNGTNGYLVRAEPSGSTLRRSDGNIDAPLALAGGKVFLLAIHYNNDTTHLDSFSAATLAAGFSPRIGQTYRDIAGTGAGLLVLDQPCSSLVCSTATVRQVATSSGALGSPLRVRDALTLVPGPSAVVITDVGGTYHLVRLAR